MKRKFAIFASAVFALSSLTACGSGDNDSNQDADVTSNVEKPKEISMMVNTFMTGDNNEPEVQKFCDEYQSRTGIKLNAVKPLHESYYESINISLATDDSIDLYEVGSLFYPSYAMYDLLWDMTDAWEKSSIKSITDEDYVNILKIDGRLYGFPLTKGNGTVTYVRKDWLDKLNISEPKTYDEFYDMLKKFKATGDDIIPITGAGLVNSEAPYSLYLREFYQDASPDFVLKNGKYVDGMTEPEMTDALKRLKQAYSEGLLDKDVVKNKTSSCRNKFYDGVVGCFNYWAGTWGMTMNEKVKELDPNAEVKALKPINGVKYLERPPLAMVISKNSKNPEGVFKYLIEYSHDGGEGQMLFTRGIENYHWKKVSENKGEIIPEHKIGAIYLKSELSFNNFVDIVPIEKEIAESAKIFNDNSELAPLPVTSKKTGDLFSDVDIIRREIIESVVTTDMTIEEGMAEYNLRASKLVQRVLEDLNSPKENTENESKEE